MILKTASGDYPIPAHVAEHLPQVVPLPDESDPDHATLRKAFDHWIEASPQHGIDLERWHRWHLVQEESAAIAVAEGRPYVVTTDGLD